jgi:hypothetical protein
LQGEITERIATVQHSRMDQLSGDIVVLKKYLKGKRVPDAVLKELNDLCEEQRVRRQGAVDTIRGLLED